MIRFLLAQILFNLATFSWFPPSCLTPTFSFFLFYQETAELGKKGTRNHFTLTVKRADGQGKRICFAVIRIPKSPLLPMIRFLFASVFIFLEAANENVLKIEYSRHTSLLGFTGRALQKHLRLDLQCMFRVSFSCNPS